MARTVTPRGRLLPEILSVLAIYAIIAVGAYIFASHALAQAPDFSSLEETLPAAVLAVLPLSLFVLSVARARRLVVERKEVGSPAKDIQDRERGKGHGSRTREPGPAHGLKASHRPEGYVGELGQRIGGVFDRGEQ
jgi:hypothetical protein